MTPAQRDRWLSRRPGAKAIYEHLVEHPDSTSKDIARACPDLSSAERRSAMMSMKQQGIIRKVRTQTTGIVRWRAV